MDKHDRSSTVCDAVNGSQQSREQLGYYGLRYSKFLFPIWLNVVVVHLLLVYKSSAMVLSKIHHQFHSRIPRQVLHNLYPLLTLLQSYVLLFFPCHLSR
jgi:hypothetical protein